MDLSRDRPDNGKSVSPVRVDDNDRYVHGDFGDGRCADLRAVRGILTRFLRALRLAAPTLLLAGCAAHRPTHAATEILHRNGDISCVAGDCSGTRAEITRPAR